MKNLMTLLLLVAAFLLHGCVSDKNNRTEAETSALQSFANDAEMANYLKKALTQDASQFVYPLYTTAVNDGSGASTRQAFSTTNLQEGGVDEADRMKNDGSHMFYLGTDASSGASQLQIRAFSRLEGAASTDATASLLLPSDIRFNRMYLTGSPADSILAIGESGGGGWYAPNIRIMARDWFIPWHWRDGRIEMQFIDVKDRTAPELGHRLAIDGYQVASRRIGNRLYLVSRFSPSVGNVYAYPIDEAQVKKDQQAIEDIPLEDLLPKWQLDGVDQGPLVTSGDCFQLSDSARPETADLIVVTAIDLSNPTEPPRSQCLVGGSEAVYMSTNALYVATSRQDYSLENDLPVYGAESVTDIHKFALVNGLPAYRGTGSVNGHLGWEQDKKSFRMGEHDGVLRVATSVGQSWDNTASTRLTVLREGTGTLEVLSTLPNERRPAALGKPGEQLYAARFVGARAYLVTFRLTDPLYVLDLANPEDPRIAGELSIPGYSDYLHPIGERWLLGVGKDAVAEADTAGDGRGAWYQGVKVALFDVADPAAPREVNSLVIGRRGSESAASYDHHAIAFLASGQESGELGRLALPIQRHETQPSNLYYPEGDPRNGYDWSDTGLHIFNVTDSGVQARKVVLAETAIQIQGPDDEPAPKTDVLQSTYPSVGVYDDRAVLVGDDVHYLHGDRVWSAAW